MHRSDPLEGFGGCLFRGLASRRGETFPYSCFFSGSSYVPAPADSFVWKGYVRKFYNSLTYSFAIGTGSSF